MPRTIKIRDDGFWWKDDKSNCYMEMSQEKWDSLGQTVKLKDLLDIWWNSVRVRVYEVNRPKLYTEIMAYKTESGKYRFDGMTIDESTADILDMLVEVDDEYMEDGDGFPIVYATVKKNQEE